MLIPINQVLRSTGEEFKMLLNTNYIVTITPVNDLGTYIKTRIVMPGLNRREAKIIYSNYTISYITGLLTKAKNKNQEAEE